MAKPLMLILAVFLSLTLSGYAGAQSADLTFYDFETALKKAAEEDKLALLYFRADWCGFCRRLETEVFTQPRARQALEKNVVPVSVNVDKEKNLARRYRAQVLPTLTFIKPDGELLGYWEGFADAETLERILDYIAAQKSEAEAEPK